MLRLSETRDALNIVGDQISGPTPARDIALACLQIAEQLIQDPSKSGTYHFNGTPDVSWADFADKIFDQAGKTVAVTPISTKDYPTPAQRPLNSRMDCTTTKRAFGIERPGWVTGLKTILEDLEAST
jgi:dTDP-4-dehydrorhamnose reductase